MTAVIMGNPFTMPTFSEEKHVYMGLFDVEKWYEPIRDFTFETSFIPLTKDEGKFYLEITLSCTYFL